MKIGEFTITLENNSGEQGSQAPQSKSAAAKSSGKSDSSATQAPSSKKDAASAAQDPKSGLAREFAVFPIEGGTVNSGFGDRVDPLHRQAIEKHGGIDIPAPKGTPIMAADEGVVIVAGPVSGFGTHAVYVKHPNGLVTIYGHGSSHNVKVGQRVTAGQKIAEVGSEGNSSGDHLHFGVIRGFGKEGHNQQGVPLNPMDFFAKKSKPLA